jgi:hypothetical protein
LTWIGCDSVDGVSAPSPGLPIIGVRCAVTMNASKTVLVAQ